LDLWNVNKCSSVQCNELYTIFIHMQDNPNQRCPPYKSFLRKKKLYNFIHLMHKACQILSAITNQGHSRPSFGVFMFLTHTANFPILYTAIPQHISPTHLLDIQHFWNPSQSLLVRCTAMLFWSTAREVTLGFLIIPVGVKAQSSVMSHSLYSCLRCLKGLFTPTPSPCSCEVIHPIMTTMFMFMQLPVISAFISGVHCLKCIQDQHYLFSQDYPWPYVPHH